MIITYANLQQNQRISFSLWFIVFEKTIKQHKEGMNGGMPNQSLSNQRLVGDTLWNAGYQGISWCRGSRYAHGQVLGGPANRVPFRPFGQDRDGLADEGTGEIVAFCFSDVD